MPSEKPSWIVKILFAIGNTLLVVLGVIAALLLVAIAAPYIEALVFMLLKLDGCRFVGDLLICK